MRLRAILKSGDPWIWLTGGAVATSLLMIAGLLLLVATKSLGFFWPAEIVELKLKDGTVALGQVRNRETIPQSGAGDQKGDRLQLQVGNRDLYGADFRWIDDADVVTPARPEDAVVLERREWGNFFGFVKEILVGEEVVASGPKDGWVALHGRLPAAQALAAAVRELETVEVGNINNDIEAERLARLRATRDGAPASELREIDEREAKLQERYAGLQGRIDELTAKSQVERVVMVDADGREKEIALSHIVRAYRPNAMSVIAKSGLYLARLWEFVSSDPRESNTEGGIFPAIFGTVMMVILMSIAVVPFGVLAALYLREYARDGVMVRIVRIAVNNLAGVPSIVFGVFGLGFFVYFVGGSIDALFFPERLPTPTFGTGGILWAALTLALLTVPVVVVATEEALAAVPKEHREGSLALGATKFETIWRVVLPSALPGVLTGLILAMARGAGEVAPLMITGVVKLAPSLPFDGSWPFLHLDRKFMHLGFHIYDVGFQSPNVEAAKPMVYATTLLLVLIIVSLNLSAILLRNRLRRRLSGGTF
jgi:phosphate transport system permease protein